MILYMTIKLIYFNQIKSGHKKLEFRRKTQYWKQKLEHRKYSLVCFRAGYSLNSPTLYIEYLGYRSKTIQHPFFGTEPVQVYAIKLGRIVKNTV